jgi:hypothetical protein
MKLKAVAGRFQTLECLDAYSGLPVFKARLALSDDSKRDSVASERRILTVAPGTVIPGRRVIEADGERYIIGSKSVDGFYGEAIRDNYVAHEAPLQAEIRTLGQICRDESGRVLYTNLVWFKNAAFVEQTSDLVPEFQAYFSSAEDVEPGQIAEIAGKHYLFRAVNTGPSGTSIVMAESMQPGCIELAGVTAGVYDPLTDLISETASQVLIVRLRWQALFQYRRSSAPKFGPDDIQVAMAKSVAAVPGMRLTLADGEWFVQAVADEDEAWLCRATRHA